MMHMQYEASNSLRGHRIQAAPILELIVHPLSETCYNESIYQMSIP